MASESQPGIIYLRNRH